MKNILITGAGPNGFVGRNLKEMLMPHYKLFTPPKSQLDLLDSNKVKCYVLENKIDVIIHCAVHVPMINGNSMEMENDMLMYFNLENVSTYVDKIIYFGSGAEYDKRYNITMVDEECFGKSIPVSSYGLAKYTMNKITRKSENIYNLRLFGIYGKYELWQVKFISNLCCKAIYDLPLTIRKNCNFDFLYIDDLGHIIKWFIENTPKYKDYNICSGTSVSLLDIAKTVKNVSEKNIEINILNDGNDLDYTASNARLFNEITDLKITDLKNGVSNLYKYYLTNKDIIDFEILNKSK